MAVSLSAYPIQALDMSGGIYSDERCPVCGSVLKDTGKAVACPNHPTIKASAFKVQIGRKICRRFRDYVTAQAFLGGIRAEKSGLSSNPFDARNYQVKEKPLSFTGLSSKWLEVKKSTVGPKHYANLARYIGMAQTAWGDANVKLIGYAEIEDLLLSVDLSDKTKANMKSAFHDFWQWLRKRRVLTLAELPEMPVINFELGWRKIIDKTTQAAIIDEVKRQTYAINPRVWIGVKWLATYFEIRPGEILSLKEGNILRDKGVLIFPNPKEKKPKLVPLLDEDLEILNGLPVGFPNLPFFRHFGNVRRTKPGQPFGEKYLYKKWVEACTALDIEGVDLYGGTRHSSAHAARESLTFEEVKTPIRSFDQCGL